jgi:hypothetical protein
LNMKNPSANYGSVSGADGLHQHGSSMGGGNSLAQ